MKAITTAFLTLALFTATLAQPVITRADLIHPGDNYYSSSAAVLPVEGPSGADVTWDFHAVITNPGTTQFQTVDASLTPFIAQFPGSNIAFVSSIGLTPFIQYEDIQTDKWEELGYIVPMVNTFTFENPRTFLEFPFTYNDQWQDDFTYTNEASVSQIIYTGQGSINATVDGYGTLMLPQTTFDDVLRIKIIGASSDTADLGGGLGEQNFYYDTTYVWFSPSYYASLCTHSHGRQVQVIATLYPDTITYEQQVITFKSFSFDPTAMVMPSAVRDEFKAGQYAFQVSPNPCVQSVRLAFHTTRAQEMQLLLQDIQGRVVYQQQISADAGDNAVECDLTDIPSGAYTAILKGPQGVGVQKLIRIDETR